MTAAWKFFGKFFDAFCKKIMNFLSNIQRFLQVSVITFWKNLVFKKSIEDLFRCSYKIFLQLRKFSIQVVHCYVESKIELSYNLFNSRTFKL